MKKFLATYDLHFGYERRNGHKVALHDPKAWDVVMKFAQDFKPDVWIHGGDMLDCGAISHHNSQKPGRTEGLRLYADALEGRKVFIEPVEKLADELVYITGNHEDWLNDLTDAMPTLEGLIDLRSLLNLGKRWKVVDQGGMFNLGKLTFIHGDTLSGGEHCAKAGVIAYERNLRFGHFHTYQAFTKTSPLDYKLAKTGIAIPCLCTKSPKYGEGKPNKWVQGFDFGYVDDSGMFTDYISIITDGKTTINGKIYK